MGSQFFLPVIVSQLNLETVQGGIRLVRNAEVESRVSTFSELEIKPADKILILFREPEVSAVAFPARLAFPWFQVEYIPFLLHPVSGRLEIRELE